MSQTYTLDVRQRGQDPLIQHDTYTMLHVNEASVSLVKSEKRVGTNQNGKTWVRFGEVERFTCTLRAYPDGRPRVNAYRVARQRGRWGERSRKYTLNATPYLDTPDAVGLRMSGEFYAVAVGEFLKIYEAEHGPTGLFPLPSSIAKLAYPILRDNPKWKYVRELGPALRQANGRAFVEAAFGKTRYRKDLMKAVAESYSLEPVGYARAVRGLVPIDWIVEFLRDAPHHPFTPPIHAREIANLRKIAALTDQRSVRRLMNGLLAEGNTAMLVQDSIRSFDAIIQREGTPKLGRVESWRQVHDELESQARRAASPNRQIPQKHAVVKALDGLVLFSQGEKTEYRITSAKFTDDMENWGAVMGHCIGSYANTAVQGRGFYFAIHRDGQLHANVEVAPDGSIRQLYGPFNARVPQGEWLRDEMRKVLPGENAVANLVVNPNAVMYTPVPPYRPAAPGLAERGGGVRIPLRHALLGDREMREMREMLEMRDG